MNAERPVQPSFSIFKLFSSLTVAIPIMYLSMWLRQQPSRWPGSDVEVGGYAEAVRVGGGLHAWRVSAKDRRFGGMSALGVENGRLLALTDSGVVVRFTPPRGMASQALRVAIHDLPGGPGSPLRKSARDSESMLADPTGRGWWVGYEGNHSLWLYDRGFRTVLLQKSLMVDWPDNLGGEAMIAEHGKVAVLPELGGKAVGSAMIAPRWTTDSTRMPDGRLVLLIRKPTLFGYELQVRISAGAGKPARRIPIDVGRLDNLEGIAAVPMAGGGTRLWIVADDNFRPWLRSLLVALDLPAAT